MQDGIPRAQAERLMRRCLELADRGGRAVRPNPMVGCVVVRDGEIVGEGWHRRYGGPHAEVEALRAAGERASGATLVVTLEPCNHQGRTPPCTGAIIASGIREVIVGRRDPNPAVAGRGIERLRAAGIRCSSGILREECSKQLAVYLVNILEQRAFAVLKVAQTIDGFIAPRTRSRVWISGGESRAAAHALRADAEAVLVGAGTLRIDDPALTVRHVRGRDPRRVVLTASLDIPLRASILNGAMASGSMVVTTPEGLRRHPRVASALRRRGVSLRVCDAVRGRIPADAVLRLLYREGLWSVLVEGGAGVFSSFLAEDRADRLHMFVAPSLFGEGLRPFAGIGAATGAGSGPRDFPLALAESRRSGADIHLLFERPSARKHVHGTH
jgi:diaminohydroxyphosphoribosylaminopyrimidine deaminase/5-amino-6-(5-phosphoribosylamino)uracil reductase